MFSLLSQTSPSTGRMACGKGASRCLPLQLAVVSLPTVGLHQRGPGRDPSGPSTRTRYATSPGPNQNNWLRTSWVPRDGARRVLRRDQVHPAGLQQHARPCRAPAETFNLYYLESDRDLGASTQESQFLKIDTIAADRELHGGPTWASAPPGSARRCAAWGPSASVASTWPSRTSAPAWPSLSLRVYYKKCPTMVRNAPSRSGDGSRLFLAERK